MGTNSRRIKRRIRRHLQERESRDATMADYKMTQKHAVFAFIAAMAIIALSLAIIWNVAW